MFQMRKINSLLACFTGSEMEPSTSLLCVCVCFYRHRGCRTCCCSNSARSCRGVGRAGCAGEGSGIWAASISERETVHSERCHLQWEEGGIECNPFKGEQKMRQIKASWILQQPKENSSRKTRYLLRLICIYFNWFLLSPSL